MQLKRKFMCICVITGLLGVTLYVNRPVVSTASRIEPGYHKIIDFHVKQLHNITGFDISSEGFNEDGNNQEYYHKTLHLQLNRSDTRIPLITLFTTFKTAADRVHIHSNVLKNWALFQPFVRPVLFVTDTDPKLVKLAVRLGWEVLPCPETNAYGTPCLKAMYQKTMESFRSMFYGYCNGDILFEYGLVDTLKAILESHHELKRILVIGQRTNFPVANRTIFDPKHVKKLQKTEGSLFQTDAEDYFLMSNSVFPWDKIPNFVIGRMGYDNYFVTKAVEFGFSLVDATETLLALHQTGVDGNYAGHGFSKDKRYNYRLIEGNVDISKGITVVALYKTVWKDCSVEVWHRITKADPRLYKLKSVIVNEIQYIDNY